MLLVFFDLNTFANVKARQHVTSHQLLQLFTEKFSYKFCFARSILIDQKHEILRRNPSLSA
jgi:hypothetical protein